MKSYCFHILIARLVFQALYVCRREWVNFWLNCQFSRIKNVHIYIIIRCHFNSWNCCFHAERVRVKIANKGKNCKSFLGLRPTSSYFLDKLFKLYLFAFALPCLDSAQYSIIFPQSLITEDFLPLELALY